MHATEAASRLAEGQKAHLDFLTPLGIMAFWPIAQFLKAGFGAHHALMFANLAVPLVFLPAMAFVAATRMGRLHAILFGTFCITLGLGGVFGGTNGSVSMSLYYNRWCWMVAFVLIATIILDPKDQSRTSVIDGIIIGACLSFLALVKMSYFVAFAPAVVVGLLSLRHMPQLAAVAVTGLLAMGFATLIGGGIDFWTSYAADLNFVRTSEIRSKPGESFINILTGPKYLPATLILLIAVIGLRHAGFQRAGLVLLLLVPGLAFVTYQNWGNDPQWLVLIAVLCFVWAVQLAEKSAFGTDARTLFFSLGLAALVLGSPSFINVTTSVLRNLYADTDEYIALLDGENHAGLMILRKASFNAKGRTDLPPVIDPMGKDEASDLAEPLIVGGVTLTDCSLSSGYYGKVRSISDDLKTRGYGGQMIGWAASFNPLPLVGGFAREPHRPVWYYGGATGLMDTTLVVLPTCPVVLDTFKNYVRTLQDEGVSFKIVVDTPHYRLAEVSRTN